MFVLVILATQTTWCSSARRSMDSRNCFQPVITMLMCELKYNVKKTKMMVLLCGPYKTPDVLLNGTKVQVIAQYRYLGHIVTRDIY